MKQKHSPLPFFAGEGGDCTSVYYRLGNGRAVFVADTGSHIKSIANARFIVRACNNHDEMRELLEAAYEWHRERDDTRHGGLPPMLGDDIEHFLAKLEAADVEG